LEFDAIGVSRFVLNPVIVHFLNCPLVFARKNRKDRAWGDVYEAGAMTGPPLHAARFNAGVR